MSSGSVSGSAFGKDKGDKQEVTLKDVVVRLTAIVRPLQPLCDQVPELVAEQGQQLAVLQLALAHVESTMADPGMPWLFHRRNAQDGVDAGEDFIPLAQKLQFLTFDDKSNPLPWLNRCDRYFHLRHSLEDKKVAYATFNLLDDTQLWYYRLELNDG
jgi:hypothetical protein